MVNKEIQDKIQQELYKKFSLDSNALKQTMTSGQTATTNTYGTQPSMKKPTTGSGVLIDFNDSGSGGFNTSQPPAMGTST